LPIGNDNSSGLFYSRGSDGDIRGRAENVFNQALGNPDTLTNSGGFSLQFAYIDDTQVEAILRAVQKYERVNTVTAPKLVVANTQRAHLQVITHVAYIKDYDVEIAQNAVIADPIVDVVKEGVILDVRPTVSSDRRFVTLELRPTVATLVRPFRTFTSSLAFGGAVTFEVPELKKESIKTTVVMPDGATLLLGGMKLYDEQDFESGIPILKDIPILSLLFSRKGKYTGLKDLIVLLKVNIIVGSELEPGSPVAR
jgi:type II secretory pathway component GspD/PulD (secretin)